MKKLALVLGILLLSVPASATLSVPQFVCGHGHVSPLTINISPTNGNTLELFLGYQSLTAITSVKDNNSNNFTQDLTQNNGTVSNYIYRLSNVSGVTSVSVTWGSAQFTDACVLEVAGQTNSSPIDASNNTFATDNSNPYAFAAVTTTNANDIVAGMTFHDSGSSVVTTTGSWTCDTDADATNGQSMSVCYQIVSSTNTYTPQGANGAGATLRSISISYKAAAGGGGGGGFGGKAGIGGKGGFGFISRKPR